MKYWGLSYHDVLYEIPFSALVTLGAVMLKNEQMNNEENGLNEIKGVDLINRVWE
ncbi:hypothetical protein OKW96_08835 [Sphingobacterium sp. KU25419]|jgi:hypothetical protein|nr:hypothetical protein OKW96_08835 [Sphingobacterium sp. KU25419]